MKRIFPYPLLFITAIVLDRVVVASTQVGINQSLRALFILLLSATLITLIVQYFVKDREYTDFIVFMIPVTLIVYRSSYRFLKSNFYHQADELGLALIAVLGTLYAITVHYKVWKSIPNPARLTSYFNLVFIILLILQVIRIGKDIYHISTSDNDLQATIVSVDDNDLELKKESQPNIYVIVLDGYARQDVLRTIYKHDNSEFIAGLERRGFFVATENHSNYVQTAYAMASFWNFDYLQPWNSYYGYAEHLFQPIQNNRVFRALENIGYTTVSFGGALHYTEIKTSDVYLSSFLPLSNFEAFLLADGPIEPLSKVFNLSIPINTYKTHRERMLYQLDTLKEVPLNIPGPKIVYTHILAPHPPFVFYENGTIRESQKPFSLAEEINLQGGIEGYWNGYQEQIRFVNGEIIKVIDAILTKSETLPIIVLMGDHGPASMFNWNFDDPGCLWERTSNLYAILLPGHQNDGTVYPSISPVNTFRVIFNAYFGTDLPVLADKSYMMSWQEPALNMDITNLRDSRNSCTISNE